MNSHAEQVVITGAGLVTCLGLSVEQTWEAVCQGRCGIAPMSALEQSVAGAEGGQAPELPAEFHPRLPREVRYLKWAIAEALRNAGGRDSIRYSRDRCGVLLGTTLHGMRSAGQFLRSGDYDCLADFLAGATLSRATEDLEFDGCAATTCSACSSSLGSIAMAVTLLQSGQLDLVLAGGYDTISEYVYGGFNSLRLVAPGPLRPFARGRQGMKLAEGYGIVVLERAEDAMRRSATIWASMLGCGESSDAHHLTQPHPQGEGAARAVAEALNRARITPKEVGLIAAHATGTPDNDAAEYAALSRVFGEDLRTIPVVAFKSHLGHTLGGAGAVELILSAMTLREQLVPTCANVHVDDIEFPWLRLSTTRATSAALKFTVNTSLGFGGANTCAVLGAPTQRWEPVRPRAAGTRAAEEVFVTGIGVVLPGAIGTEAFVRLLHDPLARDRVETPTVPESEIAHLLNARRVRRMSDYVKLSLAATMLCLRDAGVHENGQFMETCAAILGTTHGSTNYSESYYRQIVQEGIAAANPMLFAEGVPNAAAAHLSLMLSLKGPCQTIIGTRTAGLDALRLAQARIACGQWERALVGAAEEQGPLVESAYRHFGLHRRESDDGLAAGSGAVTILLESRRSMESHGGRALGRVTAAASIRDRPASLARATRTVWQRLGGPRQVFNSANGTWTDRAEGAGLRKAQTVRDLRGRIAECFSVMPLASIATALLGEHPTDGGFGVICTDYTGIASGVVVATS